MDMAQSLWQLLINPNIAYLLLIIGLWASITALIMPGTGVPEATAILCIALGVIGLAQLQINAIGVMLLALGFALFILELKVASHGALTLGGVFAFALGSIFLVQPKDSQSGIDLWVIGLTSLGTLAFFGVAARAALHTLRLPIYSNPKRLIGAHGTVKQAVAPVGSVQVKSELWTAVADEPLNAGDLIVVTAIEGLRLRVARVK